MNFLMGTGGYQEKDQLNRPFYDGILWGAPRFLAIELTRIQCGAGCKARRGGLHLYCLNQHLRSHLNVRNHRGWVDRCCLHTGVVIEVAPAAAEYSRRQPTEVVDTNGT